MFCIIEIFGGDRLVVGNVAANEHNQVAANPIRIRAGRRRTPDSSAQCRRAWRMADTRAGIYVVGAKEAGHFLVSIVSLVGEPAGSEVPAEAMRIDRAQAFRRQVNRCLPGNAAKSFV